MIRTIIFDCFGVLTSAPWSEYLATLTAEKQQQARDLNHALDRGLISQQEFFNSVHELTGESIENLRTIMQPAAQKNEPLLAYIKQLSTSHTIGLLSNVSSDWITSELLTHEEAALFTDMTLSYQTGMIKPNPNLYKLAAERLGCSPAECVMVDDMLGNCQGAEAVGMKSILYTNFTQFKTEVEALLANPN